MTTNPTDLIAIANSELAQKLNKQAAKEAEALEREQKTSLNVASFEEDIWKAVFTLNIFRYLLSLTLLGLSAAYRLEIIDGVLGTLLHPTLFVLAATTMLFSAIAFTYLTRIRRLTLSHILAAQFSLDLVLVALLTHATGSVTSGFAMLFLIVVTTGSVVLHRRHAIGLASGAFILLFYEHVYSVLSVGEFVAPRYDLLAGYGAFLLAAAWIISYLALRIQVAEKKSFVPGTETIEEFLVREEVNALKSALEMTNGNKTEAAKLIGMKFRSFRYKLTKYEIS